MGSTVQLYSFHPADIAWMREHPGALDTFLEYGEDLTGLWEERRRDGLGADDDVEWIPFGLLARIVRSDTPARVAAGFEDPSVDLDKLWGVLKFLLAKIDKDVSATLFNSKDKLADGVTSVIGPDSVRALGSWLEALDLDRVLAGLDAAQMEREDVYPVIWSGSAEPLADELRGALTELEELFAASAARELGVVVRYTL